MAPLSIPLPPESRGIIFLNGKGQGIFESSVTLHTAGKQAIGRWDSHSKKWIVANFDVSDDDRQPQLTWETTNTPSGSAYFIELVDGYATPPHHLVAWQEAAEDARKTFDIAATGDFLVGESDPSALPQMSALLTFRSPASSMSILLDLHLLQKQINSTTSTKTAIWCINKGTIQPSYKHPNPLFILMPK